MLPWLITYSDIRCLFKASKSCANAVDGSISSVKPFLPSKDRCGRLTDSDIGVDVEPRACKAYTRQHNFGTSRLEHFSPPGPDDSEAQQRFSIYLHRPHTRNPYLAHVFLRIPLRSGSPFANPRRAHKVRIDCRGLTLSYLCPIHS